MRTDIKYFKILFPSLTNVNIKISIRLSISREKVIILQQALANRRKFLTVRQVNLVKTACSSSLHEFVQLLWLFFILWNT